MDFNTGHYDGDTYLEILEPYIVRVKEATGVLIGVQTPPHHDLAGVRELRRMGSTASFLLRAVQPGALPGGLPGKHRQYGLDRYLQAIEYCATRVGPTGRGFEPWVVNGEIIAGLEPPEDSIAIDWITGVGAVPTVCVFRPLAGTDYRDVPPPAVEDVVPVFRRLYEALHGARASPSEVAPNVHVSLVMLPEEARWLQDDPCRFRAGRLRLKAMRALFARQFQRELRRAEARVATAA